MPWQSLRNALLFNAVFSFACGVALLAMPQTIAALLGEVPVMICQILGVGLVLFAAEVAWVGTRKPVSPLLAKLITAADVAWVVGSVVLVVAAAGFLNVWGQVLILDIALVTGFCAWCQWRNVKVDRPVVA
ncbi:hypothetical protein S7S_01815 [Isoalcanivorax pacificus W11-5]|uniref:Transmembrane protein n=1 Tax=Isoalcanivorax pacificus W11-5 TaxID=391936 RepID=A0A0B4XK37_9GAMM|nr:hypothetical protein [Isoalcanivorax pacificus]AJD46787.1 hypothetical protein S7S_01815 [Isoalcanivorax pacificus W11-5]